MENDGLSKVEVSLVLQKCGSDFLNLRKIVGGKKEKEKEKGVECWLSICIH